MIRRAARRARLRLRLWKLYKAGESGSYYRLAKTLGLETSEMFDLTEREYVRLYVEAVEDTLAELEDLT